MSESKEIYGIKVDEFLKQVAEEQKSLYAGFAVLEDYFASLRMTKLKSTAEDRENRMSVERFKGWLGSLSVAGLQALCYSMRLVLLEDTVDLINAKEPKTIVKDNCCFVANNSRLDTYNLVLIESTERILKQGLSLNTQLMAMYCIQDCMELLNGWNHYDELVKQEGDMMAAMGQITSVLTSLLEQKGEGDEAWKGEDKPSLADQIAASSAIQMSKTYGQWLQAGYTIDFLYNLAMDELIKFHRNLYIELKTDEPGAQGHKALQDKLDLVGGVLADRNHQAVIQLTEEELEYIRTRKEAMEKLKKKKDL